MRLAIYIYIYTGLRRVWPRSDSRVLRAVGGGGGGGGDFVEWAAGRCVFMNVITV